MKFRNFVLLLLVIIGGVLFFTNPDEKSHKAFIKEKFTLILNKKVDEEMNNIQDPTIKLLGNLGKNFLPIAGDQLINNLIDTRVKRKNYYLFSITQILYKEKWNPIGIGIFNSMYLFPQVEKEIEKMDIKSEALQLLYK